MRSSKEEMTMAYSADLAERVRSQIAKMMNTTEKKMFGGLGFLVNGNMACGIIGDDLIVRTGPEKHSQALVQPHTRPFDFSGRPMAGWVYVEPAGYESDQNLKDWIEQGIEFARSLPPK
jgi:TfoX/Sxy family transcriptional regulator of competence genes